MNTNTQDLNILKTHGTSIIPSFIQVDNPAFVSFMDAYFEWLESQYSPVSPAQIETVADLDHTLDEYIKYFKAEFMSGFPEIMTSFSGNEGINEKNLIRNIKQFYRLKGTEKSFQFLFNLLYGTDVEVYLPKKDLLTVSGGQWIEQKSIRTTRDNVDELRVLPGKRIRQINPETGDTVVARARVTRVVFFRENTFEVAELFLNEITGQFQANLPILWEDDDGNTIKESATYSCVVSVQITNPGTGYTVGQPVLFSGGSGFGAQGEIIRVGQDGEVLQVGITDFGANYLSSPTVVFPVSGGTQAQAMASIGTLCRHPGFYQTNEGELSSSKRIQDSLYYQAFSYVIKAEIEVSRYRDVVKRLIHPAGFAFYGSVLIKKCAKSDLHKASSLININFPRIGNYTPYTIETIEDLSLIYTAGYPAGTPLSTPGHPRSDPYWIIFPHPNTLGLANIPLGMSFGAIAIEDFLSIGNGATFACGVI